MHPHISVAGVLGSGKSTACDILARELGYTLLKENVQGNTFLPLFYKDPKRWALHSQLFYLYDKAAQLAGIRDLLATTGVIQDCPLYQDYLGYAKAQQVLGNMSEHEFALYERAFHALNPTLPVPDLIVQLTVSPAVIMQRIQKRGRDFEKGIEQSYIELLVRLQHEWISTHPHLNILNINTDFINIADHPEHQRVFIEQVRERLQR